MKLITHARARHEYDIGEKYLAGVQLTGAEVKSVRLKHGSLTGSFVKVLHGELFLIQAQINPYAFAVIKEYDPKRTRKLLLNRKEIDKIIETMEQKKLVAVPLSFLLHNNRIKVEIGLGKPLKQFQKKDKLKLRDQQREMERQVSSRYR